MVKTTIPIILDVDMIFLAAVCISSALHLHHYNQL